MGFAEQGHGADALKRAAHTRRKGFPIRASPFSQRALLMDGVLVGLHVYNRPVCEHGLLWPR